MRPGWAWEKLYEPLIRRAAGLGRLQARIGDQATPAETLHTHADVLVVGGGPAGLTAARELGACGLRVLLTEQDVTLGGGTLLDERWHPWRAQVTATLAELASVRVLTRTAVLGAYGHGVFAALETLVPEESRRFGGLRERLHIVRAPHVVLASGATEQLLAFPGNDTPGVMLAGAALAYLRRYGVACGTRPAFFIHCDEAYAAVFALQAAGARCVAVIDPRPSSPAAARAEARGIPVHRSMVVAAVAGRGGVEGLTITAPDGGQPRTLAADSLFISGGYSPATALATQLGGTPHWREDLRAFTVELPGREGVLAGGARGQSGLAAAVRDGAEAARRLAAALGLAATDAAPAPLPEDAEASAPGVVWEVRAPGKAFVDLQHDVTADDVRLAQREGYEHVEHMKRYTTHGMATDQGRIGGLTGSAILAQARGVSLAEVGLPRPRPYSNPVPFAALAGAEVREHFKPKRRLPLHAWHEAAGATFVAAGLWLRPLVYAPAAGWEAVLEEARAVRTRVGLTDVSSLGKIDVQGPDAARFLDFIYANTFSSLPVGRARYGIMLREDGMLFDDGTTSRLASEHFLLTSTTANAAAVLEHLEFQLQANCRGLRVNLTDVSDEWAQFAVAGPNARSVLSSALPDVALANGECPFMAVIPVSIAGVPGRLFRISFSGELAYELAVPARHALRAWSALLAAGEPHGIRPYGLDALNTLRIEKGHVTGAELSGNTTAADLGFQRLLKQHGDYIGRALSQRPGLLAADRLQLTGVRPVDPRQRLRNGMQLVSAGAREASQGYITSSTPSVELPGWVGLALVAGGRNRIGTRLTAVSPLHAHSCEIELVSPHLIDPENARVRA
jgi:glycine cleavage system aminomethyltransferase T/NADPH-dependent 2,4-dienoyl-CoA reductase/sulfur reductase-like enzyme